MYRNTQTHVAVTARGTRISFTTTTMNVRTVRTLTASAAPSSLVSAARSLCLSSRCYATSRGDHGGTGSAPPPPPPFSSTGSTSTFDPLPTPPRHSAGNGGGGGGASSASSSSPIASAMHAASQGQNTASLRVPFPPSGLELPESSFLKCIEKEMMDEKYRLDKEAGPPAIPAGWEFYHPPGTSLIYGRCLWLPTQPPQPLVLDGAAEETNTTTATADGAPSASSASSSSSQPRRRLTEQHYVRIQLTTRDASLDPECDIRGEHFPFSFFVKTVPETDAATAATGTTASGPHGDRHDAMASADGENGEAWVRDLEGLEGVAPADGSAASPLYQSSVEVRCDVIDGELVVDNVLYHGTFNAYGHPARRAAVESERAASSSVNGDTATILYDNPFGGYTGPNLDEAEEEILDGIQAWLAERRIDDLFGEFVGQYSIWVEQAEYEQWLQQLHDYVAA